MFEYKPVTLDDMESTDDDNGGRFYTIPSGIQLPSVTTVLSPLSKEHIKKWRKRIGGKEADEITHRAANRGSDFHTCIERYLENDPDYKNGFNASILQSFNDVKSILDKIEYIHAVEAPLYSEYLGVAGRVDCVGKIFGKRSVIDFKTSRKYKRKEWCHNYFMQECAYSIMWEERTGQPVPQLVTIMAVDHQEPLLFIEQRDNWVRPLKEVIENYKELNGNSVALM